MSYDAQLVYKMGEPFSHIVVENFLEGELLNIAKTAKDNFPKLHNPCWQVFNNSNEYKYACNSVKDWDPSLVTLSEYFQKDFLEKLIEITGEEGLVPDHNLVGGGLHSIPRGGFLKCHKDFNVLNTKDGKLLRKINVLLFLNDEWKKEYGGHLELWDEDMKFCYERILPKFNTLVIFDTSQKGAHGHPHPLQCPPNRSRNSMAFYYYLPVKEVPQPHSTIFKEVPENYQY